ncbi:TtrR Response regulator [Oxalobacteraceae bacterium]
MQRPAQRRVVTVHDQENAARHARGLVTIVDDDDAIREALVSLLHLEGYATEAHASAASYLEKLERAEPEFPGPHCLLLDVKMPGLTGLELQRHLIELCESTPIVFMSGGSGAPEAVQALKNGASDFLVKPFEEQALLGAIGEALQKVQREQASEEQRDIAATRISRLSARELQIAKMVSSGALNRDIAEQLGIAVRTVKLHRMHMMSKLQVSNVIELARIMDSHG